MYLLWSVISFQLFECAVDIFDLTFHHWHPLGKIVVLSYLPGQLLDFCIGNCLGDFQGCFTFSGSCQAGDYHTCRRLAQVFSPTMPSAAKPLSLW